MRDLGLPRDALVSVIVRDDEAIAPRGSTRIRAGDRLHILVRREVAKEVDALQERWRHGPIGRAAPAAPPAARVRRRSSPSVPSPTTRSSATSTLPSASSPARRRPPARPPRSPGALVALEDGRYAVTGPLLVAGSRDDVTTYARRRAEGADPDDRAWLQTVVGALAIDIFDAAPAQILGSKDENPRVAKAG